MCNSFDCENLILEILIKRTITFSFKMCFKIIFLFTYKEIYHFTVMCVILLFGLKFNCENRARNINLVRRGAAVRLYIINISF